jgi:hypothetical protein
MNINSVYLTSNVFSNNNTITSVDLNNIEWKNGSMAYSFYNCTNLSSISNVNENIVNMYNAFFHCSNLVNAPVIPNNVINMGWTFGSCRNLVNAHVIPNSVTNMFGTFLMCSSLVNAPVIPNSVTDMRFTFESCSSLVNAPVIPNSVTSMFGTFFGCSSLVNAPTIPDSVTDMQRTFMFCNNLTGNVFIHSSNITNTQICFDNSPLTKNVYIPFNSATYNSFIEAGYNENGTICGVYLKDINADVSIIPASVSMDKTTKSFYLVNNITYNETTNVYDISYNEIVSSTNVGRNCPNIPINHNFQIGKEYCIAFPYTGGRLEAGSTHVNWYLDETVGATNVSRNSFKYSSSPLGNYYLNCINFTPIDKNVSLALNVIYLG